jgi:hypothetical protein
MWDEGRLRLWYDFNLPEEQSGYPTARCMAYAESEDGIHFSKPRYPLNALYDHPETNILQPVCRGGSVWIDPNAPAESRYKNQSKGPGNLIYFSSSPDGIQWQPMHTIDVGDCDTQSVAFWDERYGRYVLYTRKWERFEDKHRNYRRVRRFESDDLVHWDSERVVWEADETDLATHATPTGQPPVDYYGAMVYRYPEAGELYVMLADAYWHWQRRSPEMRWGASGDPRGAVIERLAPAAIDVRLAWSRDGVHFHRAGERAPFLRLGPEGRFDSRMLWAMPRPIRMGDELWCYYWGINRDHHGFVDPAADGLLAGIGRAILRVDGFASIDGSYDGGQCTTPLLRHAGSQLELNLDTSGGGAAWVEVLDESGVPLPGLSREDATAVWGNGLALRVIWGDRRDLAATAGQPIRLRFHLRDCKLYAFRFRA